MCGIVGYVGPQDARDVVLDGLRRLEYRGYDSAGIAVVADGQLSSAKKAGKLANLEKVLGEQPLPPATVGIGHTRWATHGGPTDRNAHPHLSADGTVAVIHNGIIENFAALRAECEATGVEFRSETDTEVAAHLLAAAYAAAPAGPGRLAEAMRVVCRRLEGAFTLVATSADEPDTLVAARRSSPLVVGVGRRRVLPGVRRRRLHRPHPRGAGAGPGPGRGDRPVPRAHRHRLRRFPRRAEGLHGRLGRRGRREGRLRLVHAQGDRRAASGRGRHVARPPRRPGPAGARRGAAVGPGAARHRQDLRRRLRHGLSRRPDRQVRHRALDPHPGRGGAGQRVPLPRPGAGPLDAGRGRSASRARPWTR